MMVGLENKTLAYILGGVLALLVSIAAMLKTRTSDK